MQSTLYTLATQKNWSMRLSSLGVQMRWHTGNFTRTRTQNYLKLRLDWLMFQQVPVRLKESFRSFLIELEKVGQNIKLKHSVYCINHRLEAVNLLPLSKNTFQTKVYKSVLFLIHSQNLEPAQSFVTNISQLSPTQLVSLFALSGILSLSVYLSVL